MRFPTERLNEMIIFSNGKSIKPGGEGTYPVYGSNGIIGYCDQPRENNGVIIGRVGAYCGSVAYCPGRFWASDNTIVAYPKNDGHDIRFLYYLMKDLNLNHWAGGAAQPLLTQTVLNQVEAASPLTSIQQKTAAILSAYDDLIENNLRRIKILEEMAQAIYREWFVNFRFPEHQKAKMVNSSLGKIPEGWEVRNLGDIVADIIDYRGKTPKKLGSEWSESGILALSAKNIKNGQLINLDKANWVSPQLFTKWMKCELQIQDILMTSEAPLGELYYLARNEKYCLSQRLFAIRADSCIIKPSVLYYELSSPVIQAQIHKRATGTTVLGIRQALLREVPIIVPPRHLQGVLGNQLDNLIELKANRSEINANLRATRDLLLPRLISGELDVSELDIRIKGNES